MACITINKGWQCWLGVHHKFLQWTQAHKWLANVWLRLVTQCIIVISEHYIHLRTEQKVCTSDLGCEKDRCKDKPFSNIKPGTTVHEHHWIWLIIHIIAEL